jgi:hypothetical protein
MSTEDVVFFVVRGSHVCMGCVIGKCEGTFCQGSRSIRLARASGAGPLPSTTLDITQGPTYLLSKHATRNVQITQLEDVDVG